MSLPPKGIEDKTHPKNLPANPESGPSLANRMCSPCSGFLGNRYSFANRETGCWARGRQGEDTEKGPGSGRPTERGSETERGRGERQSQRRSDRQGHSRKTRKRVEGAMKGNRISSFAVFTHARTHTRLYKHTDFHKYVQTHTHVHVYIYTHLHIHEHTHICIYTHTQKYAHTHT